MYSRHRVAGYSIDHVIKFLFFLLVPVVILDIMISCFVIFSMRSQSIQSLQDTTSLYASQIDTAHISINRYLIRLLTENDDADTLLETQDKLEFISSAERVIWKSKRCVTEIRSPMKFTQKKVQKTYESHQF